MRPPRRHTLLIFSQTFVPDPAAVGQHVADVAIAMARRGHRVIVFASARGYEDPTRIYPSRENLQGVEVRRFPIASFGKSSLLLRIAGTFLFMLQCLAAGLFSRRVDGIFFSTSPPLIGVVAAIIHIVRDIPIAYWAMDLNPDQLVALRKISPTGLMADFLESVNRFILRESALVIALDRFMADRLRARMELPGQLLVLPPWSQDEQMRLPPVGEANPFRIRHGLDGKFVVMYSGNHSPSNPLTTLLDAAVRLQGESDIVFLLVGGGSGKRQVERYITEHRLTNVISLPYQPLAELGDSLSCGGCACCRAGRGDGRNPSSVQNLRSNDRRTADSVPRSKDLAYWRSSGDRRDWNARRPRGRGRRRQCNLSFERERSASAARDGDCRAARRARATGPADAAQSTLQRAGGITWPDRLTFAIGEQKMRLVLICFAAVMLVGCDKPVHEAHLPTGSPKGLAVFSLGQ